MSRLEDGLDSFEREKRRQEKKKKSEERGKKFWKALLFTENGRPKSGFLIYTFCLAIAFFAIHYASYYFIIDLINPVVKDWPLFPGNLTGAAVCSMPALIVGYLLHRLFSDKRLMLGTYIWLALLAVAAVIAMAVILRGTGAMREFLLFFLWFVVVPLLLGLVVFYCLYKRDHRPEKPNEEEPEYKKYIR